VKDPPAEGSSHCCSHIQQRAYLVESLEVKVPDGWAAHQADQVSIFSAISTASHTSLDTMPMTGAVHMR